MAEMNTPEDFRIKSLDDNTEILTGEHLKSVSKILESALDVLVSTEGLYFRLNKVEAASYIKRDKNVVLKIAARLVDRNKVTKKCLITLLFEGYLDRGFKITLEFDGELKVVKICKDTENENLKVNDKKRTCFKKCNIM